VIHEGLIFLAFISCSAI